MNNTCSHTNSGTGELHKQTDQRRVIITLIKCQICGSSMQTTTFIEINKPLNDGHLHTDSRNKGKEETVFMKSKKFN